MKKRGRLEIIKDILNIIISKKNKIRPTPLLRFSNLSPQIFNRYLKELIENKIIIETQEGKTKYYSTSKKGLEFLEKYKVIKSIIDDFGL